MKILCIFKFISLENEVKKFIRSYVIIKTMHFALTCILKEKNPNHVKYLGIR